MGLYENGPLAPLLNTSVAKALNQTADLHKTLLYELTDELNYYHALDWKPRQYDLLLGNWLIYFIHIVYERWHFIRIAQLQQLNTTFDNDFYPSFLITPTQRDLASHSIASHIRTFSEDHTDKIFDFPESMNCLSGYNTFTLPLPIQIHDTYFIRDTNLHSLFRLLSGAFQMSKLLPLASPILFFNLRYSKLSIDKTWRLDLAAHDVSTVTSTCRTLLKPYLPVELVEGFQHLYKSSRNNSIKFLYSANSIHHHIPFKFLAARNPSIKLLTHQHGGCYALDHSYIEEDYERRVSDIFYTWGWVEDDKTRPLPVPQRINPIPVHNRKGILLKCVNYPKQVHKFFYHHIGQQVDLLINDSITFAGIISDLELEISYYARDYDWNVRGRFTSSNLSIPEKSRLTSQYKILTYNYVATGWLESLAANIPTICFYNPTVNYFRPAAEEYITSLENVGILHSNPISAAEKVRQIYYDPESWWNSKSVQSARLDFVGLYARFSNNWPRYWRNEFVDLLNK